MATMPVQHESDAVHGNWLGLLAQTRLRDSQPGRGPLTIAIDTDQVPVHLVSRDDGSLDLRRGRATAADVRLSGAARLIGGYLSGRLPLGRARGMGLHVDGDEAALSRLTSSAREDPWDT
jgi:hypothetical protein